MNVHCSSLSSTWWLDFKCPVVTSSRFEEIDHKGIREVRYYHGQAGAHLHLPVIRAHRIAPAMRRAKNIIET